MSRKLSLPGTPQLSGTDKVLQPDHKRQPFPSEPSGSELELRISPELNTIKPVPGSQLAMRRAYVKNGGGALFSVDSNPAASAKAPWFEIGAFNTVNQNAKYIEASARKWGVDPDLIRAVMYLEETHGYYDRANPFNKSIRPMNVHVVWGDFAGTKEQLSDPEFNINAGAKILAGIQANLTAKDRTVEKIATLYNMLGAEKVTDYGAQVSAIYAGKPWRKK